MPRDPQGITGFVPSAGPVTRFDTSRGLLAQAGSIPTNSRRTLLPLTVDEINQIIPNTGKQSLDSMRFCSRKSFDRIIRQLNMPNYITTQIFTPTSPARLTFVERDTINDQLVSALKIPGKQVVVYGYTGCGKTTVLTRKLEQLYEDHVTSSCTNTTTFEALLINAFERLETFYSSERTHSAKRKLSASLEAQLGRIKAALAREGERSEETKAMLLVPPQLTPQTLAQLLGELHKCWVLEDFHKVVPSEKVKLAQCLKVFMDMADHYPAVKIIAIGAVDSAREVVQFEPEMRNRVSEILVPLMTPRELSQIVRRGATLLGVRFSHDVIESIVWFSNGLASVCHSLCLYTCEAAGIHDTSPTVVILGANHFQQALDRYVTEASDSLKFVFEKAFRPSKKTIFDNYRIVVRALSAFDQDGATKAALHAKIKESEPKYPQSNLKHCLNQLTAEERGCIVRYSPTSASYSFADPVFRAYALSHFREKQQHFPFSLPKLEFTTISAGSFRLILKSKSAVTTVVSDGKTYRVHRPRSEPLAEGDLFWKDQIETDPQ
jgi:hypothetical protein